MDFAEPRGERSSNQVATTFVLHVMTNTLEGTSDEMRDDSSELSGQPLF